MILKTLILEESLESMPFTEKEKPETLFLRICFSKKLTKEYAFYLVK